MKTYQPHPECMMQECMEEQGDYVLRDDALELADDLRAALTASQGRIAQLEEAVGKYRSLLGNMQWDARKYLEPDNFGCIADWFINRILWFLDGPLQREADDFAESALSTPSAASERMTLRNETGVIYDGPASSASEVLRAAIELDGWIDWVIDLTDHRNVDQLNSILDVIKAVRKYKEGK